MTAVRRLAGASAVLAALVGAPLLASSAAGSTVTGGTLATSRTSGIPGEELVVALTALPGPASRQVTLQRCVGYVSGTTTCSYWVAVQGASGVTTTNHAYTFHTRVHAMDRNAYRVTAPATGASAAVVTPARAVRGVQQEATIAAPATATVGSTIDVQLAWAVYVDRTNQPPGRPGRLLALQQRNADGSWSRVGPAVVAPASGTVTVQVTPTSAGTRTYRTLAYTWEPTGQDTRVGWFPSYPTAVVVP